MTLSFHKYGNHFFPGTGKCIIYTVVYITLQARNQDFMWGGANEAKADPTTEMYFLSSDPFI